MRLTKLSVRRLIFYRYHVEYTFPTGDQLQERARRWVSPPDPSTNHVIARRIHCGESAVWFTRGHTFDQWNLMGGLLWIHGIRASFLSLPYSVFSSLMAIYACSGIWKDHPMVGATSSGSLYSS